MTKIKVVQVFLDRSDDPVVLDDKGRLWHISHYERDSEGNETPEWGQVLLPDEPEVENHHHFEPSGQYDSAIPTGA